MAFRLTGKDADWFQQPGPPFAPVERLRILELAIAMVTELPSEDDDTAVIDATPAGTVLRVKREENGRFRATIPGKAGTTVAAFGFKTNDGTSGQQITPSELRWDSEATDLSVNWNLRRPERDAYETTVLEALAVLQPQVAVRDVARGERLDGGVEVLDAPYQGPSGEYLVAVWPAGGGPVPELVFTAWCHDDRYAGDRTPADREPHERDRVSGWTIHYVWTPVHPGEHGHLELADSPLGARIIEALSREQIHTVSDLVSRSPSMLLDIKSMGSRGIERIEEWLSSLGIAWRDSRQGR